MEHIVKKGECLSRIANKYKIPVTQIWNDPANKDLRERRKTPNILHPGDKIFIDSKRYHFKCKSGIIHNLTLKKNISNPLRISLRDSFNEPLANVEYTLTFPNGEEISGKTDSTGKIETSVPIDVENMFISFLDIKYQLVIGDLNPISKIEGIQQRLNNLGFYCGKIDGIIGPKTRRSLFEFQRWARIPTTGMLDETTSNNLECFHDGILTGISAEDRDTNKESLDINDNESCDEKSIESMDDSELENLEI